MKKILTILLIAALCLPAFAQGAEEQKPAEALKLGMVTDAGTIDDRGFNQGTYEGLKRAADELGLQCTYLKPEGQATAQYVTAITDLYDQGYKFVVTPGFLFSEAVAQAGEMFPDINIVLQDSEPTEPRSNVVSIYFKEHESGFLAGVATALKIKTGEVGFVGGIAVPAVQKFNFGFQQGIAYANKNFGTTVEMRKENFVYSGSFSDLALGQQLANTMYANGVKVVFAAAGGTGVGCINEAKNRRLAGEDIWVVGVDVDQYHLGDTGDGNSAVLTSAMKYVDQVTYDQTMAYVNGHFEGGKTFELGVAEDAVGIPKHNPNLTPEIEAEVAKVYDLIAKGSLVISPEDPKLL